MSSKSSATKAERRQAEPPASATHSRLLADGRSRTETGLTLMRDCGLQSGHPLKKMAPHNGQSSQLLFDADGRNGEFLPRLARKRFSPASLFDPGTKNHHPGKSLSLCLFKSCSHQEFRPILQSLRFVTVASPCCAVHSGHKLDTTFLSSSVHTQRLCSFSKAE